MVYFSYGLFCWMVYDYAGWFYFCLVLLLHGLLLLDGFISGGIVEVIA